MGLFRLFGFFGLSVLLVLFGPLLSTTAQCKRLAGLFVLLGLVSNLQATLIAMLHTESCNHTTLISLISLISQIKLTLHRRG